MFSGTKVDAAQAHAAMKSKDHKLAALRLVALTSAIVFILSLFRICIDFASTKSNARPVSTRDHVPCTFALCVIAYGHADSDESGLRQYFAKHKDVPGFVVLSGGGSIKGTMPMLTSFNAENETDRKVKEDLGRVFRDDPDPSRQLNAIYAAVMRHIRPCSIWEMDVNANITTPDENLSARVEQLLQVPPQPSDSSSYFGIRLRGHQTGFDRHPPVVNAYPLFSPSVYYAPRGFPTSLVHEDRKGQGDNAPELVRVRLRSPSDAVVLQSAIDGAPDAADCFAPSFDAPIHHAAYIPAIIVSPGTFHPYGRMATLHRYDALWSMFMPVLSSSASSSSFVPLDSDVLRGYIAQAVFPLIGRYLAITRPLVSRAGAPTAERSHNTPNHPIINHLSQWTTAKREVCAHHSRSTFDCQDAGTLLVALYSELAGMDFVPRATQTQAKKWVAALRSAGYRFPVMKSADAASLIVESPRRPRVLNAHVIMQLNWANKHAGVLPLWHATHAAEYKQVTYHVSRRPDNVQPFPNIGIYPQITFSLDDRPGEISGHLSYQCAIQGWGVNDPTTDVIVYTQEDAFVDRTFLSRWWSSPKCVAVDGAWGYLPQDISVWNSSYWDWAKDPAGQMAMKHFIALLSLRQDRGVRCAGHDFATDDFVYGQSDVILIRTSCNGVRSQLLFDVLQAAEDANLFLEMAWQGSIKCAFAEQDIFKYKLYTRWDDQRTNLTETWKQYLSRDYDAYHPIKTSNGLMLRLKMRDDGWAREGA